MFTFTYIPQAAVMALFSGPLAVVSTTLLVFNESSLLINAICRDFLMQDALTDTFDAVRSVHFRAYNHEMASANLISYPCPL